MVLTEDIRLIGAQVRFDYRCPNRSGHFLFSGKSNVKTAIGVREQQIANLRNTPLPGIIIEEVDLSSDIYYIYDETRNREIAYAPALLKVRADALDDLLLFVLRDEFRKIQLLEPSHLELSRFDIEKLFSRSSERFRSYAAWLERRYNEH